ncbi:MAG: ATP-dependent zinc metalloprotease FtsH, partial [Candidatus Cloacimonadaceae bacterium]|nr:ATP-dependent zinc metalloprotease FtsH [Candidatus Cloacimonadaceae bacterium]
SIIRSLINKKRLGSKQPPTGKPGMGPMRNQPPGMKKPSYSISYIFIALMITLIFWHIWGGQKEQIIKESYTNFNIRVLNEEITAVDFAERDIYYTDLGGKKYQTMLPFEDPRLVDALVERGIKVSTIKPSRWIGWLSYLFPFLLIIGFWMFFMRGMNSQNSKAFSFGKSKARLHEGSKSKITFKDVAGVDEAKEELQEIVEFLKDPSKFQRLGGRIPRGVLLVGRPGTGKTLLAKAVSGEAGVPFFSISGSDFVEMFVGVGAARVRDLFDQAKKSSPCITFIDEIDAVGRHRGTGLGGGHDEREQTLNQLLVEMDGFEPNEAVIIIAATNRPDILDPALLRPGRFDRQVTVDLPDIKGRTEILRVHAQKVPLGPDISFEIIARGTPGFSGADLANIVNEAALIAASKNKKAIEMRDFEEAKDKLILGKEKKSRVIHEDDKKLTAYHEIGHVLTSVFLDKTEPVHKVSIIPRGFTGGATHYLLSDRTGYSRSYLKQMLVTLMGGRVAEELVFDELTTGAGNDLERSTQIAKKMVCTWGMSDKIGPMTIGKEQGEVFLGKELVSKDIYSEETSQIVDSEIRGLIHEAHATAVQVLKAHEQLLHIMARELVEKETLGTEEIFSIILANSKSEELDLVKEKMRKAQEIKIDTKPEEPVQTTIDDLINTTEPEPDNPEEKA